MTRVLHASEDLTGIADKDERYRKVLEYVQDMHLAMAKDGTTYLAVIERDEGLRLAVSPDIAKLNEFLDSIPETAQVFEVHTRQ
jgi:hypothetical protein